jgi:hypothetical protein
MDGGAVQIDWDEASRHVVMIGPVTYVCQGTLSPELDSLLLDSLLEPDHGAS